MRTLSLQVSEAELDKLSYERVAYPHSMIQKRIFAVYLKAALQYRNEMIGLIVGLHYNVVSHWIEVYKANGFEGLLSNNYGTNTSELASHAHINQQYDNELRSLLSLKFQFFDKSYSLIYPL